MESKEDSAVTRKAGSHTGEQSKISHSLGSTKTDKPYSWTGKFNIETFILPEFIHRFNASPIKMPAESFEETGKVIQN